MTRKQLNKIKKRVALQAFKAGWRDGFYQGLKSKAEQMRDLEAKIVGKFGWSEHLRQFLANRRSTFEDFADDGDDRYRMFQKLSRSMKSRNKALRASGYMY